MIRYNRANSGVAMIWLLIVGCVWAQADVETSEDTETAQTLERIEAELDSMTEELAELAAMLEEAPPLEDTDVPPEEAPADTEEPEDDDSDD